MQISQSAGYAIHGLLFLHLFGKEKTIQLGAIAKGLKVSESYLSKVFQVLAKSSLVSSFRGAKGGFKLNKPGEMISIREVIEMLDGPIILSECRLGRKDCNSRDKCEVFHDFYQLQQSVYESLENMSIADIDPSYFDLPKNNSENILKDSDGFSVGMS